MSPVKLPEVPRVETGRLRLREASEIRVGDVFYNTERHNMLRVKQIGGGWAHYHSWRPDGTKQSQLGKVKVENLLRLPYFRAKAVHVYTDGASFGFGLTPEMADRKPGEVGYLG